MVCYWGCSYMLYEIGPSLRLWDSWHYSPQIVSVIVLVIAAILPKKKKEKKVSQTAESVESETKKDK